MLLLIMKLYIPNLRPIEGQMIYLLHAESQNLRTERVYLHVF